MTVPADDPASIGATVARRGITDVLHFTTSHGLIGIMATGKLLARTRLREEEYLEHILKINTHRRYEEERYWDYVNLSISAVNQRFLDYSRRQHPTEGTIYWVILHVDPAILSHDGVLFAPSNMAYDGVVPGAGPAAFEALFAPRVPHGFGNFQRRAPGSAPSLPSNPQAEVLYPGEIDTTFLRRVTVATAEDAADVEGVVGALGHPQVQIVIDPRMFGG